MTDESTVQLISEFWNRWFYLKYKYGFTDKAWGDIEKLLKAIDTLEKFDVEVSLKDFYHALDFIAEHMFEKEDKGE